MVQVSIVIPTYNRQDEMVRAVNSALRQTFSDWEIIIVDDGSNDDTKRIASSLESSKITYIRHEENQGGSAARNTGIKNSTGDYIAFLDDDDEWHPKKLELQVEKIRERDDIIAVYCDSKANSGTIDLKSIFRFAKGNVGQGRNKGGEELIKDVLSGSFSIGGTSTLLVEKSVLEKINGFDEELPRHQDLDILIRILKNGKITKVGQELVTKHGYSTPTVDIAIDAKRKLLQKYSKKVVDLELYGVNIVGYHRFFLARICFRNGDVLEGLKFLRNSKPPTFGAIFGLFWQLIKGVNDN